MINEENALENVIKSSMYTLYKVCELHIYFASLLDVIQEDDSDVRNKVYKKVIEKINDPNYINDKIKLDVFNDKILKMLEHHAEHLENKIKI